MIELRDDSLVFQFPEVHEEARLEINLQKTLRIPDDGRDHPLPPGLGSFPLRHVDDYANRLPSAWHERGGVMMPMYQAEAMWIDFSGRYPFAVRIAAGKINAVSGKDWEPGLQKNPQNYLVTPDQPWLDGYSVEKGLIRQFVAMPLGEGYSAEEQLTGKAAVGGIQIEAFPMKRKVYERHFGNRYSARETGAVYCMSPLGTVTGMGLAAGGRMRQEIYDDEYGLKAWSRKHSSRCFVHIANSDDWRAITDSAPPGRPPTAADYSKAGLPWFEYYDERLTSLDGSDRLRSVKSLGKMFKKKKKLLEDAPIEKRTVVEIGARNSAAVREWAD